MATELRQKTGASRRHNRIVLNLAFALDRQLRDKDCEIFAFDMRVRVPEAGLYTCPDVVVCGEPLFADDELSILLNPVLLIEVISRSTADYDRGTKFASYRALPSVSEYLCISEFEVRAEHWVREERWVLTETQNPANTLELPSIGCTLALSDVYDRVFS